MKLSPLGIAAFFALLACLPHAVAAGDEITVVLPGVEAKFSLPQLRARLKEVSVTIDDPLYKQRKTFDGFLLADLLKEAGLADTASGDEVVFTAKDGYSPNTSFGMMRAHRAIVAFREQGKPAFENLAQGKAMVSPAPYYLVWEEGAKLADKVPWPYQLVKIEVVDFKVKYAKLYPDGVAAASDVMNGFLTFKKLCVACHSINLQGGDVGPELNAPLNVTEYWPIATLKRFIRDAPSFRYKSKMPAFPQLNEKQVGHVIEYLKHMKGQKIGAP
jgi:mono/diheme cytochrome c family protein